MAKRASKEETILNYFKSESLEKVEVVFNLVKAEVKSRQGSTTSSARKPRAARKGAEGGSNQNPGSAAA